MVDECEQEGWGTPLCGDGVHCWGPAATVHCRMQWPSSPKLTVTPQTPLSQLAVTH